MKPWPNINETDSQRDDRPGIPGTAFASVYSLED
jgi:hypothetical protein